MAAQIRFLIETLHFNEGVLRTLLVPPPSFSWRHLSPLHPEPLTPIQRETVDHYVHTVVTDIATRLAQAKVPIPFFVLSGLLDALSRMTIRPTQAFFLSVFIKSSIKNGTLQQNAFCDGRPVHTLIQLLQDIASDEQYGIVLYNQYLLLECFLDLLYRHHGAATTMSGSATATVMPGEATMLSAANMDVLDVFCVLNQAVEDKLFDAVTSALEAVNDGLSASLRLGRSGGDRKESDDDDSVSLHWADEAMNNQTSSVNAPVSVGRGRRVAAWLLYCHSRLSIRSQPRPIASPQQLATILCPIKAVRLEPKMAAGRGPLRKMMTTSDADGTEIRLEHSSPTSFVNVHFHGHDRPQTLTLDFVSAIWPGQESLLCN